MHARNVTDVAGTHNIRVKSITSTLIKAPHPPLALGIKIAPVIDFGSNYPFANPDKTQSEGEQEKDVVVKS